MINIISSATPYLTAAATVGVSHLYMKGISLLDILRTPYDYSRSIERSSGERDMGKKILKTAITANNLFLAHLYCQFWDVNSVLSGESPLNVAILHDRQEISQLFLRAGADPYHGYGRGNSPIELILKKGEDEKTLKMALELGGARVPSLYLANEKLAPTLIDHAKKYLKKTEFARMYMKCDPLRRTPFRKALDQRNYHYARYLLDRECATFISRVTESEFDGLLKAGGKKLPKLNFIPNSLLKPLVTYARKVLSKEEYKKWINEEQGLKSPSLLFRALMVDIKLLQRLLDEGADALGKNGADPLLYCLNNGCINKMELLLKHGADPTKENVKGEIPFMLVFNDMIDLTIDTRIDIMTLFLNWWRSRLAHSIVGKKSNINPHLLRNEEERFRRLFDKKDYRKYSVLRGALSLPIPILEQLLSFSPPFSLLQGKTELDVVLEEGNQEKVALFRKCPGYRNQKIWDGITWVTLLQHAAEKNSPAFKFLLEIGASFSKEEGQEYLRRAILKRDKEMIQILQKRGVVPTQIHHELVEKKRLNPNLLIQGEDL